MFDTDHLNTFFLDNLPIFAVGVSEQFKGPNDEPREVPDYTIKSLPDFAAHVRRLGSTPGSTLRWCRNSPSTIRSWCRCIS